MVLTGCYGIYEGKAEKNIKTAEQWDADTFQESKQIYEQAVQTLAAARQADAGGQGSEARARAKEAAELSEQACSSGNLAWWRKVQWYLRPPHQSA